MAPSAIHPTEPKPSKRPRDPIENDYLPLKASKLTTIKDGHSLSTQHFDPKKHLAFKEPSHVHTIEEIGFAATYGISPVAVSEPFPIFSEEIVNIMRSEILNPVVQEKHGFTSDVSSVLYLRGFAPTLAPFTYEAWNHPTTLSIVSKIAGIDLVPCYDYEIAHVNTSTPAPSSEYHPTSSKNIEDGALVGWHRDSHPFVCVVMLSDTSKMIGGETALKTGTGEIKKIRGPSKDCGAIMQGRYIDHQALRTYGGSERITMLTSFRPLSPFTRDESVLHTVRPISNLSDLYGQTVEYQLENVEARVRRMLKDIRREMKTGNLSARKIKGFLENEIEVLGHLNAQIVEEGEVMRGHVKGACEDSLKIVGGIV